MCYGVLEISTYCWYLFGTKSLSECLNLYAWKELNMDFKSFNTKIVISLKCYTHSQCVRHPVPVSQGATLTLVWPWWIPFFPWLCVAFIPTKCQGKLLTFSVCLPLGVKWPNVGKCFCVGYCDHFFCFLFGCWIGMGFLCWRISEKITNFRNTCLL